MCSRMCLRVCVAAILMTSAMTFQRSGMIDVTSPADEEGRYNLTLRMDRHFVEKTKDNSEYVCVAHKLDPEETYILQVTPHANSSHTHHMDVYGCHLPGDADYTRAWDCTSFVDNGTRSMCLDGPRQDIYVWSNDAPTFTFPKDSGYRVSGATGNKYLVLWIHYGGGFESGLTDSSGVTLTMTKRKMPLQANYLMVGTQGATIPPRTPYFPVEVSSLFNLNYTIKPISFLVHAHLIGVVVSGYRVRGGQWTEIGRMSPQLPQMFYPLTHPDFDLQYGDGIAVRCSYNSMSRDYATPMGIPGQWREMCNFYILYSTDYKNTTKSEGFWNDPPIPWTSAFPHTAIPTDASALPPSHADWVRAKFNDTSAYKTI